MADEVCMRVVRAPMPASSDFGDASSSAAKEAGWKPTLRSISRYFLIQQIIFDAVGQSEP